MCDQRVQNLTLFTVLFFFKSIPFSRYFRTDSHDNLHRCEIPCRISHPKRDLQRCKILCRIAYQFLVRVTPGAFVDVVDIFRGEGVRYSHWMLQASAHPRPLLRRYNQTSVQQNWRSNNYHPRSLDSYTHFVKETLKYAPHITVPHGTVSNGENSTLLPWIHGRTCAYRFNMSGPPGGTLERKCFVDQNVQG